MKAERSQCYNDSGAILDFVEVPEVEKLEVEIKRLQEEREAKDKIIEQLRKMVVNTRRLEYKFGLIQGRIGR